MGGNYVLSLQPTFTQGLILGQLSILVLLVLILKYLFLDSTEHPFETSSYHPRVDSDLPLRNRKIISREVDDDDVQVKDAESAEWFNMLLQQVRHCHILFARPRGKTNSITRWWRFIALNYEMIYQVSREMKSLGNE
jgi:hypothetical protein